MSKLFVYPMLTCYGDEIALALKEAFPDRDWVVLAEVDGGQMQAGFHISTYSEIDGNTIAERLRVLFRDLHNLREKLPIAEIIVEFQRSFDRQLGIMSDGTRAWTLGSPTVCPIITKS